MTKKTFTAMIAIAGLLWAADSVQAAPKLAIDTPEFHFGYTPQNAKVSHSFTLRSDGEDSLRIVKVIPGCGCTKVPLEKTELAPGEKTDMEVIFSSGRYHGRITKRPKIETNAAKAPANVIIHVDVVRRPDSTQPIVIKPYKLDISQFGEKVRDKMEFTITNVSSNDLNIRLIDLPRDVFQVTLAEVIPARSSIKGMVRLLPDALEMPFEKSFTLECDDPNATRFTVPVKRAVKMPGASKPMTANVKKKSQ
ncbi:MAG: DUF1573 domain-containing protein [Proteobacteria bacterium]|nr:DUF1573 domain-containing protein [Pseudomonadota bacterium]